MCTHEYLCLLSLSKLAELVCQVVFKRSLGLDQVLGLGDEVVHRAVLSQLVQEEDTDCCEENEPLLSHLESVAVVG